MKWSSWARDAARRADAPLRGVETTGSCAGKGPSRNIWEVSGSLLLFVQLSIAIVNINSEADFSFGDHRRFSVTVEMLIMDPRAYGEWAELEHFDTKSKEFLVQGDEELQRAVADVTETVDMFKGLADLAQRGDAAELLKEYEAAYRLTLKEAARKTMAAALQSLGKYPDAPPGSRTVEPLAEPFGVELLDNKALLAMVKLAPFEQLAAAIKMDVERRAADVDAAARLRAASFIADFGCVAGLGRVSCPEADALLEAFHKRLDKESPDATRTRDASKTPAAQAMRDAFAPYADLFSGAARPWDWVETHPDEAVGLGLALGGLALGVFFALTRGGSARKR